MGEFSIDELKVGQQIWLGYRRRFDFAGRARVEAVGYDWAVARDNKNQIWLLEGDDTVGEYTNKEE